MSSEGLYLRNSAIGTGLGLVNGVQEVGGSSPVAPDVGARGRIGAYPKGRQTFDADETVRFYILPGHNEKVGIIFYFLEFRRHRWVRQANR
jgi:hypothetical protein